MGSTNRTGRIFWQAGCVGKRGFGSLSMIGSGDSGKTSLGDGRRVYKDELRVCICGSLDEVSANLGLAHVYQPSPLAAAALPRWQKELFEIGCEIANPQQILLSPESVTEMDLFIAEVTETLPPLRHFILPGGVLVAAQLHVARTVCRRAEREMVALNRQEPIRMLLIRYMNRLSSALFVLARAENVTRGVTETVWMGK